MLLAATCLFGLEKQLGEEIDALGLKRVETIDGRVLFEGEEKDIPRANINLRLAERVFIVLGRFHAESFSELFDGTYSLPWQEWIGRLDEFPVTGHSIKSKLTSIPDCQSIVKKAIVNRLSTEYGISWFEETGVKYKVEFFILKDEAMLMIDTSGLALHKRGYRPDAGAAPLRETLAAAIALTSRPKEDVLIWDPFCGSGTIAIEAAMIARRIAPGLKREFAAEKFARVTSDMWEQARQEAAALEIKDSSFEVWASDIDEDILDVAYENALRAGVEENINIFCADARKIEKPTDRRGTIVCNPPYGERMGEMREIEQLYREIGRNFKNFEPWHIYVITSCEYFEKLYGRRADKIRKLYNGMLPCNFYQFFKPEQFRVDRPQNKTFNKNKSFDNKNKYIKPKK
ncbi:MAG: class I SAM-dependent RNA methyltransferase [Ruminococcaceae bacterium]|nr:class I SAM-dependent RNA methyltransferase [Oscillospiraceae bacterium]